MITTTLTRIRAHRPCEEGWRKLLAGLGKTTADDEPLPFARIVEINGIDDALWCCCVEPQHDKDWRLFAVWCARQVQHLMTDPRSIAALDVVERYANGNATDEELIAARSAAQSAAQSAVQSEAWSASWSVALSAEQSASWSATRSAAACAAAGAAQSSERSAVWSASWDAQTRRFLEVVS